MNNVPRKAIWNQLITLIPVYETLFMLGCLAGWLSNAVYFLLEDKSGEIHATSSQCAVIASVNLLGKVAFALPAGILTDKYGRKNIIISIAVTLVLINFAMCLNYSLITIYVSRFIGGMVEAMIAATSSITIGEISSPEIRGRLTNVGLIVMNIGAVSPSIISVTFPSYTALARGVTILSAIGLIPMFWIVETPHFLVSVSKLQQAKDVLRRIRPQYPEKEIEDEFEKLKVYVEGEKAHKNEVSWMAFMQSSSIKKPLIIGTLMTVFLSFAGIIVIKVYIAVIIPSNDFVPKSYYPLISQIVSFVMSICTTFYIDRFPRRTLYFCGTMAMAAMIAINAVASYFMAENQQRGIFEWIFILGNILLLVFYGGSAQPLNSALSAELYPQAVKGLCGSIALIAETASLVAILQLYSIVTKYSQLCFLYVIFLANALFLFSTVYFLLPESRGVMLSDVQREFGNEAASTAVTSTSSLLQNESANLCRSSDEAHTNE